MSKKSTQITSSNLAVALATLAVLLLLSATLQARPPLQATAGEP